MLKTMPLIKKQCVPYLSNNKRFITFIFFMCCFRSAVADWYVVPTGSMQPTIIEGDQITVNKMAYDLRVPFTEFSLVKTSEPKRGEIIVFESKVANERLIKRVIGLPGDVVAMDNNIVTINGKPLHYALINETRDAWLIEEKMNELTHTARIEKSSSSVYESFNDVTVPDDHYLVLGDNRLNSADSRVYGFVPRQELKGKATHIAYSRNYDNYYMPRSDRWFKSLY